MAYTPPRLRVTQEYITTPSANVLPLYACIMAPRYGLHRFDYEDEEAFLAAYVAATGIPATAWPDKNASSTVDLTSVELHVRDAILQYWYASATGPWTSTAANRITHATTNFRASTGYTRAAALGTRDVALGDYVKAVYGAGTTVVTTVAGWVANVVAATTGVCTDVGVPTGTTPTSGGTYTGLQDTTYVLEIVVGGEVGYDAVSFKVTTIDGYDAGLTQVVTGAATYPVGNYGVTADFVDVSGNIYTAGDRYTIAVTAAAAGPIRTLILADPLTGYGSGAALAVTLGLTDDIELDIDNWTATATTVTVAIAATQEGSWLGTLQSHNLLGGDVYVQYRELLTGVTVVNQLSSVTEATDVEAQCGPIHEDNPLALMVYTAILGAAGTPVWFIALSGDNTAGYTAALNVLAESDTPYSLVPFNTTRAIGTLVQSHVDTLSAPDRSMFRIMWRGCDIAQENAFYTEDSGSSDLLATIATGVLTCSNATFVTEAIRASDTVRINYTPLAGGGESYDEYDVLSVDSDTQLTLDTTDSVTAPAVRMEVWRTYTLNEYAAAIYAEAVAHDDHRVRVLWSQPLTVSTFTDLSKAYLAAFFAGLRSAVAPHQPLTNVTVSGIDVVNTVAFGATQLDSMAGNGVWLVIKDVQGDIYTRHQLTTDNTSLWLSEDSVVTNFDQVCRQYRDAVKDLYGRGNATQAMLDLIRSRLYATTSSITSRDYAAELGPQIIDFSIVRLYIDETARDHVWCNSNIELPAPMNELNLLFRLI